MTSKLTVAVAATVFLTLGTAIALAQTAAQHNTPGGPRDKVEKLLDKSGLTLPSPPPAPSSTSVSTTTVASPPSKSK